MEYVTRSCESPETFSSFDLRLIECTPGPQGETRFLFIASTSRLRHGEIRRRERPAVHPKQSDKYLAFVATLLRRPEVASSSALKKQPKLQSSWQDSSAFDVAIVDYH